jgi:hypothetical protein
MIHFKDYAEKYFNKKNPSTGKVWKTDEIAADTGLPVILIQEFILMVKAANEVSLENEGRLATDAEMIAVCEKAHPGQYVIITPFGVIWRIEQQSITKLVGELTVDEFVELMKGLLKS